MRKIILFVVLCLTVPALVFAIPPTPPQNITGALQDIELLVYSETCVAMGSDTTPDYDLSAGSCYTDTVDTGATTATFSNPGDSGKLSSLTLIITNGGSQTYNWPASVDWANGTAPSLTASGVDVIECMTADAGTTWYCFVAGLDMQ